MKRTKQIEVAGHTLTVSEIPVSTIFNLLRGEHSIINTPITSLGAKFKSELVPFAIEGDLESLLKSDLYYDDLQLIYEAFKETNPAFFEMASAVGLKTALVATIKTLAQSFSSRFAGSLNTDMDIEPGSTGMDSLPTA